jgi:hypothetical protein
LHPGSFKQATKPLLFFAEASKISESLPKNQFWTTLPLRISSLSTRFITASPNPTVVTTTTRISTTTEKSTITSNSTIFFSLFPSYYNNSAISSSYYNNFTASYNNTNSTAFYSATTAAVTNNTIVNANSTLSNGSTTNIILGVLTKLIPGKFLTFLLNFLFKVSLFT